LLQVPAHRNHGAPRLNRRTYRPATDGTRRPEDYDGGLDCPTRGSFTPNSGMVGCSAPTSTGRAATMRQFPNIKQHCRVCSFHGGYHKRQYAT
jgi:hypothetical protein